MLQRAGGWTVEQFDAAAARGATWTFQFVFDSADADADGKLGTAGGSVDDCTSNDTGTIYCTAGVRIRVVEKDRIWTLAGGIRDWIDSTDPKKVAFSNPARLRATRDGLQFVDRKINAEGKPAWKIREIALRR